MQNNEQQLVSHGQYSGTQTRNTDECEEMDDIDPLRTDDMAIRKQNEWNLM